MKWFKKKTNMVLSEDSKPNMDIFKGLELFKKGTHQHSINNHVLAIEYFKEAINCGFDSAKCFASMASCFQAQNNHEEALLYFDKAIKKTPNDCNLFFMRSNSKGFIKDFDGALTDIEKAIELSKVDSPLNKIYNEYARIKGSANITSMYESFLELALFKKENKDIFKWNELLIISHYF